MNLLDSLSKGETEISLYIERLNKRYQEHFKTIK